MMATALVLGLGACTTTAMGPDGGVAPLPDGVLTAQMGSGGPSTLTVEEGRPVAYTWERPDGSLYTAPSVGRLRNGDIRVEQARITGVVVGEDSISGTWRLAGASQPVTFRR